MYILFVTSLILNKVVSSHLSLPCRLSEDRSMIGRDLVNVVAIMNDRSSSGKWG